jgi:hypothetical protein
MKKIRVGALNVTDALEELTHLVTKASLPKGLEDWVFHECHVFHLFFRDGVYNSICPM